LYWKYEHVKVGSNITNVFWLITISQLFSCSTVYSYSFCIPMWNHNVLSIQEWHTLIDILQFHVCMQQIFILSSPMTA